MINPHAPIDILNFSIHMLRVEGTNQLQMNISDQLLKITGGQRALR